MKPKDYAAMVKRLRSSHGFDYRDLRAIRAEAARAARKARREERAKDATCPNCGVQFNDFLETRRRP